MECPYCGKERKSTREHIIPDGFIRGMNKEEQIRWTEAAPIRVVEKDLVVKDVCGVCNNGILSTLDDYSLKLITKFNGKINKETSKIVFKYNYNFLARWLLKVCYNSARANKREYEISVYQKCVDYIMNEANYNEKIDIYAAFMDLSIEGECKDYYHFNSESEYSIDFFRITQCRLKNFIAHYCSLKLILINSFAFLVVVYDNVNEEYKIELENAIGETKYNFTKLDQFGRSKLAKDKLIWKHSVLSAATVHENFLSKRQPVKDESKLLVFELSKDELVRKDYSRIKEYLSSVTQSKDSVLNNYQKLVLHVSGYDTDLRELFEIEEFIDYCKYIIVFCPEILWFMNLEERIGCGFFMQFYFAYLNVREINDAKNTIRFNPEKGMDFLERIFNGINKLTNTFALDKSLNDRFTSLFTQTLESIHEQKLKTKD